MPEGTRTRYEVDLSAPRPPYAGATAASRSLSEDDRDALASLMLDAYRGTIDDEGESIDEALSEVDDWLGGAPLLDHSRGVIVDGVLASAVLVMLVGDVAFIAFVMTRAEHKGTGLGRSLVESALLGLQQAGHDRVALVITDGNTPSERLFTAAGAVPSPS